MPRTQVLSRLAACHKPSVYPAWRLATNPAFIPLGGLPQTQRLSRLTVSTSTMTLRRKENVETLPATSQKTRSPWLFRLATAHNPRFYPAWWLTTSPGFIPLGGLPRAQVLSRLAARREPRFYPAWRLATSPVFIPLGSCPQPQVLSRLAPYPSHKPSVYG